jgi:hypothetical protein
MGKMKYDGDLSSIRRVCSGIIGVSFAFSIVAAIESGTDWRIAMTCGLCSGTAWAVRRATTAFQKTRDEARVIHERIEEWKRR